MPVNGQYEGEDKPVKADPVGMDFLTRMQNAAVTQGDIDLARERYGVELPDDVVEEIARQQAVARPVIERYHLIAEQTPSVSMARATAMAEIDSIIDIATSMDLTDLGDIGDFQDEYSCPRCAHRWSGAPNARTGYGDSVYVPLGRVSSRTGKPRNVRYGPPIRSNPNFKYGRNWRGASAAKLPRGFGNRPIGEPIVGDSWGKKRRWKDGDEYDGA